MKHSKNFDDHKKASTHKTLEHIKLLMEGKTHRGKYPAFLSSQATPMEKAA